MIVHEYAHWWLFLLFLPLELLVFVRVIRPVYPKFKFLVWRCARILYCLRNVLDYNNNERGTSQEGRPGTRFSKKKNIYAHTLYEYTISSFLCVSLKVRSNPLGGRVRSHPVGVQSFSTRMILTSLVILLIPACPMNGYH